MAIPVKPGDLKLQSLGETVVYELPWAEWDEDLATKQRDSKLAVVVREGLPPAVSALGDDRTRRLARISVRSASKRGYFTVTRTVTTTTTPTEVRKRSFSVLVEQR